MIIKSFLNQNIDVYDKWLSETLNKDNIKNIVYNTDLFASPLRQIVSFIRFVDWCEYPRIILKNPNKYVLSYNNEIINHLKYLLMCNIPINILFEYKSEFSNIQKELDDNSYNESLTLEYAFDMNLITDIIFNSIGLFKLNKDKFIFVYDKKNINKQLILSDNLIIITSDNLVKNINEIDIL